MTAGGFSAGPSFSASASCGGGGGGGSSGGGAFSGGGAASVGSSSPPPALACGSQFGARQSAPSRVARAAAARASVRGAALAL